MAKTFLLAAALTASALPAIAGGPVLTSEEATPLVAAAPAAPNLVFTLRAGVGVGPTYFGSKKSKVGPDFSFALNHVSLGGHSFGNADANAPAYGFSPRGSFRFVAERSATKSPELAGLPTVKASAEIGLGLGYTQRNFAAFVDARYGATGHKSFVGEVGADLIMHPTEALSLRVGPRVLVGSGKYANAYFGVATPAGAFTTAYDAKGGALTAGVEIGATYAIDDTWGLDGAVRFDKYVGGAKNSPIVLQGRSSNVTARIGVTRRFSLSF